MIKIKNPNKSGIFLGQFQDKTLEKEYFSDEVNGALVYIRPVLFALGLLYLLFIIPDYFLISDPKTFKIILLNRTAFFALVILLPVRIKYLKRPDYFAYWLTSAQLLVSISFLYICYQYENPNFLIQSFGVMVIITGIFMVPNRWKFKVFVSIFISTMFFFLSIIYLEKIETNEFAASLVYIFIVILLNSISSHRVNYFKRMKYLYSKNLHHQSITDPLSGIFNRQKLNQELPHFIQISKDDKTPFSLVLFDIDNFKEINDHYGHLAGDDIIIKLTEIVQKNIRKNDIFARWGGDEFIILLPNTKEKEAVELIIRIQEAIKKFDAEPKLISCSFGIVSLRPQDDMDSILHRADEKLYEAKADGKNTIVS
ncbi:GGDEF domain-containing protein [Candidatus Contubernalis alkaliaceticus]|uniref:GGDEF domain-containing protein n=1 Tax=Candidatus Contubernalis alkaliaceticus TaxID=338645 RepID=UPI001F4C07AB|nr:GGDEF domain-containing protein [Candidatus Contubernalis alkalaceticus]UNC91366.1 GGDEF domain-containing protein [Candidatus Contubernalis alkalaceticus]